MKNNNFKNVVNAVKNSNATLVLVTHNGVCHSDETCCTALLKLIAEKEGISCKVVRTRDQSVIEEMKSSNIYDKFITYDVFMGELDHHQDNFDFEGKPLSAVIDGDRWWFNREYIEFINKEGNLCSAPRPVAAVGKVLTFISEQLKDTFGIDDRGIEAIRNNVVRWIDFTDNTGILTPLAAASNAIRDANGGVTDNAFMACVGFYESILRPLIQQWHKKLEDEQNFANLPVIEVNGKKFKFNEGMFVPSDVEYPGLSGIITKKANRGGTPTFSVKMFNNTPLSVKGVTSGEMDGVIFVHNNGIFAEVEKVSYLEQLV